MLDYQTLLAADFSELSEAATKWGRLPQDFRDVHKTYENTVQKDLEGSDWKGEAATAALDKVHLVGIQILAAAGEANDVYKLLDDACEIFTSSQRKLQGLKRDIERDKYLSVKPDGEVYFDPPADTPNEHIGALNKGYQETLQAYRSSIRSAVSTAQEADDALAWALSQDQNGRGKGFNPNGYTSIADAKKGHERVDKDLKELGRLTGEKGRLAQAGSGPVDPAALGRINELIARHEGDPYFAEKFATSLGAKGTLELWTQIADRVQTGDEQTKASADIQKSLSHTLATASHSDSKAMEKWKHDVITLGDKQVEYMNVGSGVLEDGPYGFQVMSSLMRHGSYDTDFLNSYGEKLIGFEKAHKDEKPTDLWRADGDPNPYLSFGKKNDHGFDPMAGYMEALGHNSEAAKDLFFGKSWDADKKLDPELKYLLDEREWPDGNPLVADKRGFGYDELGHALEAATLGVPYDSSDGVVLRDKHTANIMEQVATTIAEDSEFVTDKPGVGDSIARMGAAYMDDLNWSTIDEGGRGSLEGRDSLYNHNGPGHTNLDQSTASHFLYNAGQHEGGYKILSAAEQAFTLGALEAHKESPESVSKILNNSGYVHGILDEARISHLDKQYGDEEDKINQKLAESAEWKKFGVSQGIGLATGLILTPFAGPAAGGAAAVVVPTLVEGVGSTIETQWGIEVDRETKEKEADLSDKNRMTATRFSDLGQLRAITPALLYMTEHSGRDYTESVLNAYDRGANTSDRTDGGRR
ncbi:DUF6571 family protein [Streptomyces sp. NPDC005925]|uniref:DUF6571 family protein n=1 Tax=Streptomyces sp. NPDC005925 TaxID=3157172 RepID=UPI00341027AB